MSLQLRVPGTFCTVKLKSNSPKHCAFLEGEVKAISDHEISPKELRTTACFYSQTQNIFQQCHHLYKIRAAQTERAKIHNHWALAKTQFSLDKRKSYTWPALVTFPKGLERCVKNVEMHGQRILIIYEIMLEKN